MERRLLVAIVAWRLRKALRDATKHNEELFKALDIDAQQAGLLLLDVIEEACEFLRAQAEE